MKREILFRGKRKADGQWVLGAFCPKNSKGRPCIIDLTSGYWYPIDPETIGQYTGLVDKNGVKIFEGDIIECWSEGVKAKGNVTQRIDGLWIIYPAWQENKMWGLCPNECGAADVEVIGNIHDKAVKE